MKKRESLKENFLEKVFNLLNMLKPISKKMMEHHTVSHKPIKDLKRLLESDEFKAVQSNCDTESKSRTIRLLSKKAKPIINFQNGLFKEKRFGISPSGISFQSDFFEYTTLIENIETLMHYQDVVYLGEIEIDPEFNEKHRYYHLLVNNIRLSIIDLTQQLEKLIERENQPRLRLITIRRRKLES